MSKSKGNVVDPLDWLDIYGADALRFTLARGASPGGDLAVGEDHVRASRNFGTKLFNATRFALLNGASLAPLPDLTELTDADRWILGRLEEVRAEVDSTFDGYEFSRACEALYHFTWDEFCDWYVELAKTQLADGLTAHHRGAGRRAGHPAAVAASGDPVHHRGAVAGVDRSGVAGDSRLAHVVRYQPGYGCRATDHGHAEAGDRSPPLPQRPGSGRPAESARPAVGHRHRRPEQPGRLGQLAGVADRAGPGIQPVGLA